MVPRCGHEFLWYLRLGLATRLLLCKQLRALGHVSNWLFQFNSTAQETWCSMSLKLFCSNQHDKTKDGWAYNMSWTVSGNAAARHWKWMALLKSVRNWQLVSLFKKHAVGETLRSKNMWHKTLYNSSTSDLFFCSTRRVALWQGIKLQLHTSNFEKPFNKHSKSNEARSRSKPFEL